MLSKVCLFPIPKWWKHFFTTCHTAVKKVVYFDSINFQRKWGNIFSLTLVFIRQEARKVASTKLPLSQNFHSFLDHTDSYFSFCWHFPDYQMSIISDNSSNFTLFLLVEAFCGRPVKGRFRGTYIYIYIHAQCGDFLLEQKSCRCTLP